MRKTSATAFIGSESTKFREQFLSEASCCHTVWYERTAN